jgi:hypothetical protein
MTEPHVRHPRWTAAALLAPASAAVFAGTMAWTTGQSAAASESTAKTVSASSDEHENEELRARLDYQTKRVYLLRQEVKKLRQQVRGGAAPSTSPTPGTTATPSSPAGSGSGGTTPSTPAKPKATTKPAPTKTTATPKAPAPTKTTATTPATTTTKPAPVTSTTTAAS